MKFIIFYLICTCSVFISHDSDKPMNVDQIIEKHVQARGGEKVIKSVKTLKLNGTIIWDGQEYTSQTFIKSPHHYRIDFGFMDHLYDGKNLWSMKNGKGETLNTHNPIWREISTFYQIIYDIEGPLLGYKEKGHAVELLGETEVDGEQVYELKVTLKNGRIEHWYIDCETYLVMMKSYKIDWGERYGSYGPLTIKIYLSDFKPVNGLMVSHYNERTARIYHFAYITEGVEVNVPLDEDIFVVEQ